MQDLKIVVVGAGIGGLCTAIALRRAGFEVEVYERAPSIDPVGAGLCVYSNGAKVLNALGLERRMAEISPVMTAVRFSTKDGEPLSHIPMEPLVAATGQRPYPVRRADLQAALIDELGRDCLTLGAEFVTLEQSPDGVTVRFADGRSANGDLLVGADGIRSTVRAFVADHAEITYLSTDWEGLIAKAPPFGPVDEFVFYVGDGKRAATIPITHDLAYWFFDFQPTPEIEGVVGAREQLRILYRGWCEPVQHLIESLDPDGATSLQLSDLSPLPRLVKGRVALIGDAGHATTPFLGQGASQAAEDGLVLARYLQTTTIGVEDALARYERERMARVQAVVAGAREMGEAATATDPEANSRYYESIRNGGRQFVEAAEMLSATGPLG